MPAKHPRRSEMAPPAHRHPGGGSGTLALVTRRVRLTLICGVAGVAVWIGGCSGSRSPQIVRASASGMETASPTTNGSTSPSWLAVGSDMTHAAGNAGVSAAALPPVLTDPQTISTTGPYTLIGGPLPPSTPLGPIASPVGLSFPPDSAPLAFQVAMVLPQATVFDRGGARYVSVHIQVTTVTRRYEGLRIWVQETRQDPGPITAHPPEAPSTTLSGSSA